MGQKDGSSRTWIKEHIESVVDSVWVRLLLVIGGAAGILQTIIGWLNIETAPLVNAINSFIFSDAGNRLLLTAILFAIVLLYRRIAILHFDVDVLHNNWPSSQDSTPQFETDGGRPRDPQGRFTTTSRSGSPSSLMFVLGGLAGYLIGNEVAGVDPIVGAIVGVFAVGIFFSSR